MIPKKAKETLTFSIANTVAIFGTALYFQGEYMNKILPLGIALLFSGVTAFLSLLVKGRKADVECDERENVIQEKTMKFCFFFMSLVLVAYWSYDVSLKGTLTTASTLLLCLFWGTYLAAYVVNRLRY